jgi:hypothetical protein
MSRFSDDIDLDDEIPTGKSPDVGRRPTEEYDEYEEAQRLEKRSREIGERPRRRGPDMENAPRPRDRERREEDTSVPVMDEALGIMVISVEHDGMTLTLPSDPEDWPIRATMAFENGRVLTAIKALLAPEDFGKIMRKDYRNKDFAKLYEKLAKAGGFETTGN